MIIANIYRSSGKFMRKVFSGSDGYSDEAYDKAYSALHNSPTARSAKIFLVNNGQYKHMETLWR